MELESMIEVIAALHLTYYVEGPFKEPGGLMLVSPPENLKTSLLDVLNYYNSAMVLSDLNNQQLAKGLRDDIAAGKTTTLAFTEMNKIYQRNQAVASNMEGNISALTAEGLRFFGHEDSRMPLMPARCVVIGCMTPSLEKRNFTRWKEDGFYRRFLWSHFRLDDPHIINHAIARWEKIDFSGEGFATKVPASRSIPLRVDESENQTLLTMLKFQPSGISFANLKKILSVLRWKFRHEPQRPMQIMRDFAASLGQNGATLMHNSNHHHHKRRK